MRIPIVHYHISTNTTDSRNNHSKFYLMVANLIRRTRIIENLARTLELPLPVTLVGLFFLFVPTHAVFPPLSLTVEKKNTRRPGATLNCPTSTSGTDNLIIS